MIPIQPLLILIAVLVVIIYFSRLRSKLWDRLIVLVLVGFSALFVLRPELTNLIAKSFGIGRGIDLIIYFSLPGFAFVIMLLFSRMRDLESKIVLLSRELSLAETRQAQDSL